MGRPQPRSLTHCRYALVRSAMPMARAEQYRNLYPFLGVAQSHQGPAIPHSALLALASSAQPWGSGLQIQRLLQGRDLGQLNQV